MSFRGVFLLIVFVIGFFAVITYATVGLPSWSLNRCLNPPGNAVKPLKTRRHEKDAERRIADMISKFLRRAISHIGADVKSAFKRFGRLRMNFHAFS